MTTIGVVVATKNAIQPALDAFTRYAPEVKVMLYVDEGLLAAVEDAGRVTQPILRRFASLVARAEESGVDGILFSCTVFSPHFAELEPFYSVPIVSVDGAMISEAAAKDGSIGLLATTGPTEKMVVSQLHQQAQRAGTTITVRSCFVKGAFDILLSDPERHDEMIFNAAKELGECDRYLLAQMSMARAAEKVAALGKPVLTSPESSVKAIMAKVEKHKLESRR